MTSAPLLALSLAIVPLLGLAACTPRPDDPAAPGPSPGEAPAAAGTAAPSPAPSVPHAAPPGSAEPGDTAGEATAPTLVRVDHIDVAVLKSFPVQIHANLGGHLSDACVEVGEPEVRREGSTFTITLPASRPPGRMCAQVLVPFQRTVPVPVRDLPKGEYGIRSHGASASFTLDRDNSFNPR